MNKAILILAIAFFVSHSKATETTDLNIQQLSRAEKQRIALAIQTLIKYQVVFPSNSNKCVGFDEDLVKQLAREGLLNNQKSILMSICIDGTN